MTSPIYWRASVTLFHAGGQGAYETLTCCFRTVEAARVWVNRTRVRPDGSRHLAIITAVYERTEAA